MWRIIMSKSDYTIRCITKGECADLLQAHHYLTIYHEDLSQVITMV